jgi:rhamnulokinase
VVSEESRLANFTNEIGVDGTVRFLRNVSGLWLLQECLRHWGAAPDTLGSLLADASRIEPARYVIDADDPVFLPPRDMPGRIAVWLRERGLPVPETPAEFVRCVLESLALAYRRALLAAQALSGRHVDVVHVVGGGARNDLLCQLTADACRLPVVAGPAEATALGNVLVQARALGSVPEGLDGMRALVRASAEVREYAPSGQDAPWEAAVGRIT